MWFLLNKKSPEIIVQFFFLVSHCYRSVEPIYKNISKYKDCDEFCTNEGINRKKKGQVCNETVLLRRWEYCKIIWFYQLG